MEEKAENRKMVLPRAEEHGMRQEETIHPENMWCAKAGCIPVVKDAAQEIELQIREEMGMPKAWSKPPEEKSGAAIMDLWNRGNTFAVDHAHRLTSGIAAITIREGFVVRQAWFDQVYAVCQQTIGALNDQVNAFARLEADKVMTQLPKPFIMHGTPASVRDCLRWAWRAARRGKW